MSSKEFFLWFLGIALAGAFVLGTAWWMFDLASDNREKDIQMFHECVDSGGTWIGGEQTSCVQPDRRGL